MTKQNAVAEFKSRLYADWLPTFANDAKRQYGVQGFRDESIKLGEFDAANFLRAMAGSLVEDLGGGRYRCAHSRANEQLFWTGERSKVPRPMTLWLEPVITIATLARLHYDLGWPEGRLGMQTADYAFDLAAYADGEGSGLVIACEVKKSRSEVDHLVSNLKYHSQEQDREPQSERSRHLNSFRKWVALRRRRPALLWIVGPDGYEFVFELGHTADSTRLRPVPVETLRFDGP